MAERTYLGDPPAATGLEPDVVIDLRDPADPRTIKVPSRDTPASERRRAVRWLLALNVLNLLDAVLTYYVTRSGLAREGNPVVEAMTLPGKVVFVAALSVLLWWLRPRTLVIPLVGYALVVCYTIGGALLYS